MDERRVNQCNKSGSGDDVNGVVVHHVQALHRNEYPLLPCSSASSSTLFSRGIALDWGGLHERPEKGDRNIDKRTLSFWQEMKRSQVLCAARILRAELKL